MNEVQSKILDIFKEVAKVCDKNKIPYYAIGGTCIGAVRHNGFIPWDDDIDIAIPIEFFEKFQRCAEKELPNHLRLMTGKTRHYKNIFIKVHNINTTFIEKLDEKYPDVYKGIFVDIMPLAGIPSDEGDRRKFVKKIVRWEILNFVRRYPFIEMYSLKTKIIWIIMRMFLFWTPFSYYSDKWMKMLNKHPLRDASLAGDTWHHTISKVVVPMDCFSKALMFPFEDTEMSCPTGYDMYLSKAFGDYMKLPPEEERQVHHTEIIDTQESYLKLLAN